MENLRMTIFHVYNMHTQLLAGRVEYAANIQKKLYKILYFVANKLQLISNSCGVYYLFWRKGKSGGAAYKLAAINFAFWRTNEFYEISQSQYHAPWPQLSETTINLVGSLSLLI